MRRFRTVSMTIGMLLLMLVTASCASMPATQNTTAGNETVPATDASADVQTEISAASQTEAQTEAQAETTAETAAAETAAAPGNTDTASGYTALLDWYHHEISAGWADYDQDRGTYGIVPANATDTENMVSYMWYRFEQPDLTQSGYQLLDINHDGTEELIVGVISDYDGSAGIYDIYTLRDGKPALLASGGERVEISVGDNVICESGSGGAALYIITMHRLTEGRAVPFEEYKSDYDADPDAPWFYSNDPEQAEWGGYEFQNFQPISEEAFNQCGGFERFDLRLTPFSDYTPGNAA